MKYGFIVSMIGLLTACASNPLQSSATNENGAQTSAAADDANKGIICTVEVPTGSSLRQKRCTTPAQRDEARRQAEQLDTQPAKR